MRAVTVPVSVRVAVPEPVTPTPPAAAAFKLPLATLRVTLRAPAPASMSATARPVRGSGVSSVPVKLAGRVFTGASLTGVTVTLTPAVSVTPPEVTV